MKAIKDIYTYQLPYYNYPVLKQVGTNEQANASKLPFDVLVDPNNHQPITLDLGAGEKIYCQVCVATMNFNSVDYLCAMLVEKQHASNIVVKGEGANVTFAVFDIKTKKGKRATDPLITTSLVEFYKILSKNKRKVVRRDLFYITEKLQDMEGTSARVISYLIEKNEKAKKTNRIEKFLSFYIPILYTCVCIGCYFLATRVEVKNWILEIGLSKSPTQAKILVNMLSAEIISMVPSILLFYAYNQFCRIKKTVRVIMKVLSGMLMVGVAALLMLPIILPNGKWAGETSLICTAFVLPNIVSIVAFYIFYSRKSKEHDNFSTGIFGNIIVPFALTALCIVAAPLTIILLPVFTHSRPDEKDLLDWVDLAFLNSGNSDGPQQSVRIWGTGDDFNDVTHSDSYYSSRHGCHVDEYRDERGNKYLSPDGGKTFYEDN